MPGILEALARANASTEDSVDVICQEEAINEYIAHKVAETPTADDPQWVLPRFFRPKAAPGTAQASLHQSAEAFSTAERLPLEATALSRLQTLLQEHAVQHSSDSRGDEPVESSSELQAFRIHYSGFVQVGRVFQREFGSRARQFFKPSTFMRFESDASGAVAVTTVCEYVAVKNRYLRLWERIASFDGDGDGWLTVHELQNLMVSLAVEHNYQMSEEMWSKWRVIAPRKFYFYFGKQGRVPIRSLVASPMWDEVTQHDVVALYQQASAPLDAWFTPEKSQAIAEKFEELDEDGDGRLSQAELRRLRVTEIDVPGNEVATMTSFFLTRLFEEHVHNVSPATGEPAMTLSNFADFLLAWNARGEPPSLKYFFKIFDLENTGKLTSPVVSVFTRHVAELAVNDLKLYEYEHLDVKDEIFDMISPKSPAYLTMQDLAASGMAHTICGMLVDGQCYWEYDQREALAQQDDDDA